MDLDHSVDLVVRHLVGLVNHLVDLRDSRQVRKDYLVDIHCMLDDLLQDDTFDYTKKHLSDATHFTLFENSRVDIDKEIFEEHFDEDSFQEDSFH